MVDERVDQIVRGLLTLPASLWTKYNEAYVHGDFVLYQLGGWDLFLTKN